MFKATSCVLLLSGICVCILTNCASLFKIKADQGSPVIRFVLLCLGIYHNRVMQMDKTNRIFYKTVIQTRRDAEIWQDIDSIVKGIKQQRESYADPPKKE